MKNFFFQGTAAFLGFTFWGAGMVKLYQGHHFIQWIGPPWLVERLSEFDLGFYAQFIATCQIIIGFMLITTRFKLLGGIMLIPMILNILMVTISLHWRGTPFVLAALLAMNIFVLWQYRGYFLPLVNETRIAIKIPNKTPRTWQGHAVWLCGLGISLASVWVSYLLLPLALGLAGLGLALGILSLRVDRLSGKPI